MRSAMPKIVFILIVVFEFNTFSMQSTAKISFKNRSERYAILIIPHGSNGYNIATILPEPSSTENINLTVPLLSLQNEVFIGDLIANNNAYTINVRPIGRHGVPFYQVSLIKTDLVKENNRWKTQKIVEEKLLIKIGDTLEIMVEANGSISMKNESSPSLEIPESHIAPAA